jgi:hypothetical protein
MFSGNRNKGYSQQGTLTGGSINGYNVNGGAVGGVSIYKTGDGRRGLHGQDGTWYEKEAGSGKFYKSSGRDWMQVSDYNPNPTPEPEPESSGGGGGSSGGSSGGGGSGYSGPSYQQNTLDSNTQALMEMVRTLTESLSTQWDMQAEAAKVSKPGDGLENTILNPSAYLPSAEKKKKSYLTPAGS